jgi:hypothetical protein
VDIKISEKRLKELERAEAKLAALEAGGVDNWEWYDEALKDYRETIEQEERLEALLEDLEVELLSGAHEPSERGGGYSTTNEARRAGMEVLKLYGVTAKPKPKAEGR